LLLQLSCCPSPFCCWYLVAPHLFAAVAVTPWWT